jgi:hypothetical protein
MEKECSNCTFCHIKNKHIFCTKKIFPEKYKRLNLGNLRFIKYANKCPFYKEVA